MSQYKIRDSFQNELTPVFLEQDSVPVFFFLVSTDLLLLYPPFSPTVFTSVSQSNILFQSETTVLFFKTKPRCPLFLFPEVRLLTVLDLFNDGHYQIHSLFVTVPDPTITIFTSLSLSKPHTELYLCYCPTNNLRSLSLMI